MGRKFYCDNRTGYWISTTYPRIRAHVWVWNQVNGKVPVGFHVHHIDEDKSNNAIDNLTLMSARDHMRHHMTEERRQKARIMADTYRHLTKEWHRSEEGKRWHSCHGKKVFNRSDARKKCCAYCDKEYETDFLDMKRSKFCSNACKSASRRNSGIDNVECTCSLCGKRFLRNKYLIKSQEHVYCGRKCSDQGRFKKGGDN